MKYKTVKIPEPIYHLVQAYIDASGGSLPSVEDKVTELLIRTIGIDTTYALDEWENVSDLLQKYREQSCDGDVTGR